MFNPKKWFHTKIDNYIIKYHSEDFIRREMIRDEITKRIKEAVDFQDAIRDKQEESKLNAQKLSHDIERNGLLAQLDQKDAIIRDVYKFRDECMALMYRVESRAKEVALITAENKHEGNNIIEAVAKSIGKLDIIGSKAENVVEEIIKSKPNDIDALRIK